MARAETTTKYEIIQTAYEFFFTEGFSNTYPRMIAEKLGLSTGNITYYFKSKEHLLAVFVEMLCKFQWQMMEKEADEGISSILAICLEFAAMAAVCVEDEIAKDFYLSAYSSDICLEIIQRNDIERAKKVFAEYCPDWTDEKYAEVETIVSGIEQTTLRTNSLSPSLETRISGALETILSLFGVPEKMRRVKLEKVFAKDYRELSRRIFRDFKEFVKETNEQAFEELSQLILKRSS